MQVETKLPKVGTTIFTVMSQLAAEHGAVNLGQGFPDFDGPQALRDALTRAMNAGHNQYAPMTGIAALRSAIANKTARMYGHRPDVDQEITVTSGATEALFAAIAAVVRPGDEVIVLDPCYDSYDPAIALSGGRAVHVPLDARDFSPDWQRIRDAITPKTRMIMFNTPHNPCGSVWSADAIGTLAELVRDTQILVLSDEVYEHIIFDGAEHQSVLRHAELAARSFVISSFGKTYHCTGWKVGYCIAPRALSAEFRKVHQYLTFSTFTPAQWALAEIIEQAPEHYLELPAFYQDRRDHFRALMAGSKFQLRPVAGAYFQVVDYSALSDSDDLVFCEWLARVGGVAAIPLSAFYESPPPGQRLVRLCFAKSEALLAQAAERLCAL
ncbi:pyridoxal phosphate-dependent aminotransferase [Dokdonella sp.]|uniref:pyridoxal phosphate-dependent aminotransferase n=1 Tax=Dokdonella sp. TaxID=2291710 RepID=UPI0031C40AD4|nr:pyridoxal phosphate-dependent aminotransferase [Dokdonella sp.]